MSNTTLDDYLGFTSTPAVKKPSMKSAARHVGGMRKRAASTKSRAAKKSAMADSEDDDEVKRSQVVFNVSDGVGMRLIEVERGENLFKIRDKVAEAMKKDPETVEMGYEAPWCVKSGTKRIARYITTSKELEEFWRAYHNHLDAPGRKSANDGILVKNMRASNAVSLSVPRKAQC